MKRLDMDNTTQRDEGISRRGLFGAIGGLALGVGLLSSTTALADDMAGSARSGTKAILYDASKCVGCHYCEGSCKNTNDLTGEVTFNVSALPEDVLPKVMIPVEMIKDLEAREPIVEDDRDAERWLRVTQKTLDAEGEQEAETGRDLFTRNSCTHCGVCAQVCPSRALVQREDGIVTVESDRCIGCYYCYQACPFDVPRYRTEGEDKTMQKCTMCSGRIDDGGIPACIEGCPTGALHFGDVAGMLQIGQAAVSSLVSEGYTDACLYGERELGGINVLSVLAYPSDDYRLPQLSQG